MAQISRPQQGRLTTYPDAGGYTANQWAHALSLLTNRDWETDGVFFTWLGSFDGGLYVTNPAGVTIRIASGAAMVAGHWFFNEDPDTFSNASNIDFTPSTPGIASRQDRVVLVQNNTDLDYSTNLEFPTDLTDYEGTASVPPHSCRAAILTGDAVTGNPNTPVFDDGVDGDIQMIVLANYTITNVPAISVGPTDARSFIDAQYYEIFAPVNVGYNVDTGAAVSVLSYTGFPAVKLDDTDDQQAAGSLVVPENFIGTSGYVYCEAVWSGAAQNGNVYGRCQTDRYRLDDIFTNVGSVGFAADAVVIADFLDRKRWGGHAVVNLAVGDIINMSYRRDADNVLDTLPGSDMYVLGFTFRYIGYKR